MDTFEFIYNFLTGKLIPREVFYYKSSLAEDEFCLARDRYIEASDLFLKEIELVVYGNDDLNKYKHKIRSLLKFLEEIEYSLDVTSHVSGKIINACKHEFSEFNLEIEDCSDQKNKQISIILSRIEIAIKNRSVISEILDRKRKVEQKLKELGIKSCFK